MTYRRQKSILKSMDKRTKPDISFALAKTFAKLLAWITFPLDDGKREDYELGILAGLADNGNDKFLEGVSFSRLIKATPFDVLDGEFKKREYLTVYDIVMLMIRANATGGVVAARNSLNRVVHVLAKSYEEQPDLPRMHGVSNIIGVWGKYKRVASYIFAYMELINGFEESDELNVEEMIMILLLSARYAQQSLKNIKTLKVDWVEGVLPDALDKILSSVSPQFTETLVFTPQERKTWLAYRAHYESKPKKGE